MQSRMWSPDDIGANFQRLLNEAERAEKQVLLRFVLLPHHEDTKIWRPFLGRIDICKPADFPELIGENAGTEVRLLCESISIDVFRRRFEECRNSGGLRCDETTLENSGLGGRATHAWHSSNEGRREWGIQWPFHQLRYIVPEPPRPPRGLLETEQFGTSGIYQLVHKFIGFSIYHQESDARNNEISIFAWDYRGRFTTVAFVEGGLELDAEGDDPTSLRPRGVVRINGYQEFPLTPALALPQTISLPQGSREVELELLHRSDVVDTRWAQRVPALDSAAVAARLGNATQTNVRELLRWFGAERRGAHVVADIRRALEERDLLTVPDFAEAYIDAPVTFLSRTAKNSSREAESSSTAPTDDGTEPSSEAQDAQVPTADDRPDHVVRLSRLKAANQPATVVQTSTSLNQAASIMVVNGYSQLPVVDNGKLVGVVTWENILKGLLHQKASTVAHCTDPRLQHEPREPVLSVLPEIVRHGFILVRKDDGFSIVTAADIAEQFNELTEAFLLISQIEQRLRTLIKESISIDDIINVNETHKLGLRNVRNVDDMTFGQYQRLLAVPEAWTKLRTSLDHETIITRIDLVRRIRNDVMHFDPDPLEEWRLDSLRSTARFFETL